MKTLLAAKGVHRLYRTGGVFSRSKRKHVLRGIDLELQEGASVALVGRSGCGKSTLGRLLLGLERPDLGTVEYRGQDIHTCSAEDFARFRRNVQVVFQNVFASVNPRMTAGEIIAEPLRNFMGLSRKEAVERAKPLLERVGLKSSDAVKSPMQFSGGELQRIAIARALASEPELVVFDEALSSLDMLIQERTRHLIAHLRDEHGLSFLFITHDLRLAAGLCKEVACMDGGTIVVRSPSVEALYGTEHQAVRDLFRSLLPDRPPLH